MNAASPESHAHPADRRDVAIGALSIVAVILFVTLFLSDRGGAPPAFADGMSVSGGDYVVAVGGAVLADEDFVYVIDIPMERVIAYRFDAARQQIEIVQGVELSELRTEADGTSPTTGPAKPTSPRRRP